MQNKYISFILKYALSPTNQRNIKYVGNEIMHDNNNIFSILSSKNNLKLNIQILVVPHKIIPDNKIIIIPTLSFKYSAHSFMSFISIYISLASLFPS